MILPTSHLQNIKNSTWSTTKVKLSLDFFDSCQRMFDTVFITSGTGREEYFIRMYLDYQRMEGLDLPRVHLNPDNEILLKQSFMNRRHTFGLQPKKDIFQILLSE